MFRTHFTCVWYTFYMSLHQDIKEQIKVSMKKREELRLLVLRGLLSAFTNELVAQKRKPREELSDDEVLKVIKRAANQRKDSIEQFAKGGRDDLVEKERAELNMLEEYLPKMISKEEIQKVAEVKKEELGITDISKMGQLMSAVMKELKSTADGNDVKEVVSRLLQ